MKKEKPVKNTKDVPKKEKKKSDNIVVNDTKIYQKMKNKSLLSIEKNVTKWEKVPHYNYKKLLF